MKYLIVTSIVLAIAVASTQGVARSHEATTVPPVSTEVKNTSSQARACGLDRGRRFGTSNGQDRFEVSSAVIDVYALDATEALPRQQLAAPLGFDPHSFGAEVTASENVLAVSDVKTGRVAVYERSESGEWIYRATLARLGPNRAAVAASHFGESLAVSDTAILIGSHSSYDHNQVQLSLYRKTAVGWGAPQSIRAPTDEDASGFGAGFATDGDTIWVSAPAALQPKTGRQGRVFSWSLHDNRLVRGATIDAPDGATEGRFGERLASTPSGLLISTAPAQASEPAYIYSPSDPQPLQRIDVHFGGASKGTLPLARDASKGLQTKVGMCPGREWQGHEYWIGDFGTVIYWYCCTGTPYDNECYLIHSQWFPSPRFQEP